MVKIIELVSLCGIGKGTARITDESVEVEINGIIGSMKVWLVGGEEAEKVGNVVDGKLSRMIDTTRHTGILVTQSGRQIMHGRYSEKVPKETEIQRDDDFILSGIKLRKVTNRSYAGFCEELRYILSNKKVYQNYRKHGYYRAGESSELGALALKLEENDENPFEAFGDMCLYKNGYVIVCVDKQTKKLRKMQ